MKNKILFLKLFLVFCTISAFKNINSIDRSQEEVDSVFNDFFAEQDDHLALRKLIGLIKNDTFENFKNYFEHRLINVNTVLKIEIINEEENKEVNEWLSEEDSGKTLLMFAVEKQDIQLVEYLISKGADVNAKQKYRTTPLSIAVLNNNIEIAKLLINKGADINVELEYKTGDDDRYLWDILAVYFYQGNVNVEMVKFIINNGYNLYKDQVQDNNGFGILEYALKKLNYDDLIGKEVIEILFNSMDKDKLCGLRLVLAAHLSDYSNNYNAIKYAINNQIINVNNADNCDLTPLHYACQYGILDLTRFLIQSGAEIDYMSLDGTPLMVACDNGEIEIVKELLNAGADITIQDSGLTAYDNAKKQYNDAKANKDARGRRDFKAIYKYGKILRILKQWNKIVAKEVMKNIPGFPVDLVGIIADKVTDSSLKADELKNINQALNIEDSRDKEEKEQAEKPLEDAVKKKKRQRDSDDKQLDQNDPNYNLC